MTAYRARLGTLLRRYGLAAGPPARPVAAAC
jgi:hypothetical protein